MSGCAPRAAPSFVLFGAYFPAWMLVALIGILAAAGARIIFVATRLSQVIPLQLLVCTAVGVIVAVVVWLLWFAA
ncbi:MAG: YtcA family lipoprotein [Steroidobacteraceae bacterium]